MASKTRKSYPKYHIPSGSKIAMILSGGGSKGAYTLGVLQYLIEEYGLDPSDVLIWFGTSTGSLISAQMGKYALSGDAQHFYDLIHIYSTVTNEDILEANSPIGEKLGGEIGALIGAALAGKDSVYGMGPLDKLIQRFMTDQDWAKLVRAKGIDVGFAVSCLNSGGREIVNTSRYRDPKLLHRALLASAKQPVFNPPTDLFHDGRLWVDGGLTDYSPIEWVFEAAPTKLFQQLDGVLAINLMKPGPYDAEVDPQVLDIALLTINRLIYQVGDADLLSAHFTNLLLKTKEVCTSGQWNQIFGSLPADVRQALQPRLEGKHHLPIMTVYPKRPLNYDGLVFEPRKARAAIRQGFREAATWFSKDPV